MNAETARRISNEAREKDAGQLQFIVSEAIRRAAQGGLGQVTVGPAELRGNLLSPAHLTQLKAGGFAVDTSPAGQYTISWKGNPS